MIRIPLAANSMSILPSSPTRFYGLLAAGLTFLATSMAHAVILLATADPTQNTTEPTASLAGSGWQYEGQFGWFLGTAIGPHHFVTVKHIGMASNVFVYQGINYTITQSFDDPDSELRIFEVAETLPTYAPLYSRNDELGHDVVVIGRGTQRGNPVYLGASLRGWEWGQTDGVQRWGENRVSEANGYTLYATFDQNGGPNEAHLSSGDSGGAMFIRDGSVWKLAGINFSVDGAFSTTLAGAPFNAVLFDTRGFYNGMPQPISSSTPVPSGFYAMRISDRLPWIASIVPQSSLPSPAPTPTPTPIVSQMVSPAPGSTFASASETFTWTPGNASAYRVDVGNTPGASDIYTSGNLRVQALTVNNIPTTGSTIYLRLSSCINGAWQYVDYSYQAYSYTPAPTPAPAKPKRRPHKKRH